MYVLSDNTSNLSRWIRNEIEFKKRLKKGSRGKDVKRVQEWLSLHGFGVVIDSSYGSVTARAVSRFQRFTGVRITGIVDKNTFEEFVSPMKSVLEEQLNSSVSVGDAMLIYAQAHLKQHPREVGGQNHGPWVRLYMRGHEGRSWPWCAGFITFLIRQVSESLEISRPIRGSGSCDSLAAQAKESGIFLSEKDVDSGTLPRGSIFLVRKTTTDWSHTGLLTDASKNAFDTIEGNTNDDGHREGYEVCSRSRGYVKKDFIVF